MSETKLPDIVERLREQAGYHIDNQKMGSGKLFDEAADEITRLRSHAGWHEAIEEAAKVAENYERSESEDSRRAGRHEKTIERHKAKAATAYNIMVDIRALLPPCGEKG